MDTVSPMNKWAWGIVILAVALAAWLLFGQPQAEVAPLSEASTEAPERQAPRLAAGPKATIPKATTPKAAIPAVTDVLGPIVPDDATPAPGLRIRILDPDGVLVPRAKLTVRTGTAMRGSSQAHEVVGGVHIEDVSRWGTRTDLRITHPRDADGNVLPLCEHTVPQVDSTLRELEIRLTQGRRLTGRVVNEDDVPVAKVYVTVRDPTAGRTSEVGFATSDEDGRFMLAALPPIPLVMVPRQPGGPWLETDPIPLAVTQSAVTIRLRRSGTYRLTVLDMADQPVAGATVHISWVNGGVYAYRRGPTDAAGVAALEGVSPTLPLAVHVLTDGLHPPLPAFKQLGVSFGNGQRTVRLGTGAVITGRIVDAEGKPVGVGDVIAEGTDEETASLTAKTTPDPKTGAFALDVKPGAYRVWLEESPGFSTSEPIAIEAPGETLRIVAPRYASAAGRLHVKEPRSWRIQWFMAPRALTAPIGPKGHFKIGCVRNQPTTLLATKHGDPRVALLENVNPAEGPIDVRPLRGERIAGRIEGLEESAPRAFVKLRRGPVHLTAPVQADGTFSIDNVPPGSWRLELRRAFTQLAFRERVQAGTTNVLLSVER